MFTCLSLHLSSQMKRPADDLPPANTKAAKANAKATAPTVAAKAKAKATATTVAATTQANSTATTVAAKKKCISSSFITIKYISW